MNKYDAEMSEEAMINQKVRFATKEMDDKELRDTFHEMIAAALHGNDATRAAIRRAA